MSVGVLDMAVKSASVRVPSDIAEMVSVIASHQKRSPVAVYEDLLRESVTALYTSEVERAYLATKGAAPKPPKRTKT